MHSSKTSKPRSKRGLSRGNVLVIVGPTASGKSALAVRLAKKLGGEVISADSRQVYKGLDIGSGKVDGKWEMRHGKRVFVYQGVVHHLIDFVNPRRRYTVAEYQKAGQKILYTLLASGYLPIVCGGTGLYVDALVHGASFPAVPPNLKLRAKLENESAEALFKRLKALDPRRAKTIDRWNKRRITRALEVVIRTGKPVPSPHSLILTNERMAGTEVIKIGISPPDDVLKRNIKKRMLVWFRGGLLREVKRLRNHGISWRRLDDFGLTYRWAARFLRGLEENPSMKTRGARALARAEMLRELEKDLWHYAKRQMTWWRRDKEITWVKTPDEALRIAVIGLK